MPLFAMGPQLNSTCSLKSWNFEVVAISEPLPCMTSVPSSTLQLLARVGSTNVQPARSLPSNNGMGAPHLGARFRAKSGALRPVHRHEAPLGVVAVPTSPPSTNLALNNVPSGKPASSGAEN